MQKHTGTGVDLDTLHWGILQSLWGTLPFNFENFEYFPYSLVSATVSL